MSDIGVSVFLPSLQGGGAERVATLLVNGFIESGMRVDLVLVKAEGPYLKKINPKAQIINLNSSRLIFSFPRLAKYLKKERPNVMISFLDHANIIALLAVKLTAILYKLNAKVIVSSRTTLSVASKYSSTLRDRVKPYLVRLLYRYASSIVAVSQGVKDDLISMAKIDPEKIVVIYNPTITDDLFKKASQSVDHKWFKQKELPVILAVGRMTIAKDYPTLIKAFSIVNQERPARLVILGEGEERRYLESLVSQLGLEECIEMPGYTENPYAYMAQSTAFVLSSLLEGLPNVLIEALALGIPIVSTDCKSGPSEILEGGKWGILVPVGDHKAMADGILEVLSNRRRNHGASIRASMFRDEKVIPQYLNLLRKQ